MGIEKVREYFKKYKIDSNILEFDVSSATVELAAKALNCLPQLIAKTLSFNVDDKPILIVVAGDAKVDNTKFKQEFRTKAKMLKIDEIESLIGHAIGGVCPFGVNNNVDIYLDISLKRFEYIYPACGSSNSAIKLTNNKLEEYSNSIKWIDVCKIN